MTDAFRDLLARPEPSDLTQIALQMLGTIESMELIIPEITDTIRKALEQGNPTPQLPADGEVEELVKRLKSVKRNDNSIPSSVHWGLSDGTIHHHRIHVTSNHASDCDRAAELLQRQHPQPVPASERLPQLRRQFEATLNEARCFTKRYVGNSELADRLIGDVLAANAGPGRIELLPDGTQIIEPAEHTLLVPVLQPVPVAERLPGPEDLDVEGTCWVWNFTAYTWGLFRLDLTAHSHWLPAHALPLPTIEEFTS